jgi:predicted RNase H-like HicB family nuclease
MRTYHVVVERAGQSWRATCPALRDRGAITSGETKEEARTHIENVILMILLEIRSAGLSPPPDEEVAGSIPLTIDDA